MPKPSVLTVLLITGLLLALLGPPAPRAEPVSAMSWGEVGPPAPTAIIPICGNITANTTWTAGNVYVAENCNTIVDPGVVLTIQAGAIVKFGGNCYSSYTNNCAFVVRGTLLAQGAEGNPVVITSLSDDAHGGDSNGDGPSAGSPGEWYGLHLMPAGQGSLVHTHLYYAGSGQWGNWEGTSYLNQAQLFTRDATLSLQDSEVAHSLKAGLALYGAATQAVVERTRIISNTGEAVANIPGGIYQHTLNMQTSYHDLTLAGNSRDVVTLNWDTFTGDVTLDGGPLMPWGAANVPTGRALILRPGTTLRFPNSDSQLVVQAGGHLTATGTLTAPVALAPQVDGSPGYDGMWGGVRVEQDSSAALLHVEIRHGGSGSGYAQNAALWLRSSDVTVRHVQVYGGLNDALRVSRTSTTVTLEDVTLYNSGRDGLALNTCAGVVTVNGGAIYGNGRYGVNLDTTTWSGEEKPQDQTLALAGATVYSNTEAGLNIGSGGSITALQDTAITANDGAAIRLHPDNDSPALTNTTLTGNALDGIAVAGGWVEAARHWGAGWPQLPYVAENDIYVRDTGALSLEPGLTLRMPEGRYIGVAGSLTAQGTPERPIRFLDTQNAPGGWEGIRLQAGSTAMLQHCEIAYGGREYWGGLSPQLTIDTSGPVSVQDCALYSSWAHGIRVGSVDGDHVVRNNGLEDIPNYAASKTGGTEPLDARYNWWGHESGPYHPTLNPDGQGVNVGDNVLFEPWLTESPVQRAGVVVKVHGPRGMAPGQTVDYILSYTNNTTETVQSAVLLARLPALATYITSTHGGLYWPGRHVVFWKLGDLEPGASGQLLASIRYMWGIPDGQVDNLAALLAGLNFNADLLDVTPYLDYTPLGVLDSQDLTPAEWDAELAANPELDALYTQALAEEYVWAAASRVHLDDGTTAVQGVLLHPQRIVRFLYARDGACKAATFAPYHYTVEDTSGGLSWDIITDEQLVWGDWDLEGGAAWPGRVLQPAGCLGAGCCLQNCLGKVALTAVVGKLGKLADGAMAAKDCHDAYQSGTPEAYAKCASSLMELVDDVQDIPVLDELTGVAECLAQCTSNPNSNDCTDDLITCEPRWWNLYQWLDIPSKTVWRCQGGCYSNKPEVLPCAFGGCCMPGAGCVSGGADGSDCRGARFAAAKDPNEKYGPAGDLLPGQWVTYTIEYENVGAGPAYGVFIGDYLDAAYDDATLQFGPNAVYYPSTRLISWDVGDLPPAGEPGAQGEVTMTVRLRDGLPGGTIVVNQATVYFPSVPEETPTSAVIHMVQPVVALPQTLTTTYAVPVSVTLAGKEASGAPLTYRVVEAPFYGALTGTPPDLSYTPMAHYSGPDRFAFVANNGVMDSRPAAVRIVVTPDGDTVAPEVLWAMPAAGAVITPSRTPVYQGPAGDLYSPLLAVQFSEPLDPSSVTGATVQLDGGGPVALAVGYDSLLRRITAYPRVALPGENTYTVTVSGGITDRAGNPLAAPYTWSFHTATMPEPDSRYIYLPVVLRH